MRKKSIKIVIPARYESTRLPGKPLIDLLGEPMIVRVYQNVKSAVPDIDIIVAIDDKRVEEVLLDRSIPYVMTSNLHLSGTDRIAEVADILSFSEDDIIINVQGDEPIVPKGLLLSFLEYCIELDSRLEIATICSSFDSLRDLSDPNSVKVVLDDSSSAMYFSRSIIPHQRDSQTISLKDYNKHLGIYSYRCSSLRTLTTEPECHIEGLEKLEQLRALWLGMKISVMRWSGESSKGIDSFEDADLVREILSKRA